MSYPVQVVLDQGNLAIRLREIREWLSKHNIEAGAFDYRMRRDFVQLRIDFTTLADAAQFAKAFGGLVFGARRTTPAMGR